MVTTDPQAVAWSLELRSSGRVCADVGRVRSLLYCVVALGMAAIGVAMLVFAGVGGRIFGGLLLALGALALVRSAQTLLRVGSWRSPQVVIDADGIDVRHGYLRVPWDDLYGAAAYTANHNRWVALTLRPERYDAWIASRPRLLRLLGHRPRRRQWATVLLPPNLAVDTAGLARWLDSEVADRRGREIAQARRELDDAVARIEREGERMAAEENDAAGPDRLR